MSVEPGLASLNPHLYSSFIFFFVLFVWEVTGIARCAKSGATITSEPRKVLGEKEHAELFLQLYNDAQRRGTLKRDVCTHSFWPCRMSSYAHVCPLSPSFGQCPDLDRLSYRRQRLGCIWCPVFMLWFKSYTISLFLVHRMTRMQCSTVQCNVKCSS